jgi:predicted dehydrogenase
MDSDALTIKKVLASGVLGEIHRMDSRFERFRPEVNTQSWRENMSAHDGGGQLLDLQPHLISTALDWFGNATIVLLQLFDPFVARQMMMRSLFCDMTMEWLLLVS